MEGMELTLRNHRQCVIGAGKHVTGPGDAESKHADEPSGIQCSGNGRPSPHGICPARRMDQKPTKGFRSIFRIARRKRGGKVCGQRRCGARVMHRREGTVPDFEAVVGRKKHQFRFVIGRMLIRRVRGHIGRFHYDVWLDWWFRLLDPRQGCGAGRRKVAEGIRRVRLPLIEVIRFLIGKLPARNPQRQRVTRT